MNENKMTPNHKPAIRESDRIEAELRRLILNLELEPGLSISESSLMKRYNWGRTPLREAFQRLAEQSLIQIIPRHGIVIMPLSIFDFVEVMDAMSMVIGAAAAQACRHLTEEQILQMEDYVAQGRIAAVARDYHTLADLDYQFHGLLADATGNRYLRDYLMHLHLVATRFNFASWRRDDNTQTSLDEHQRLASSFRQHNVDEAKVVMLEHIENSRQRMMGNIKHGA